MKDGKLTAFVGALLLLSFLSYTYGLFPVQAPGSPPGTVAAPAQPGPAQSAPAQPAPTQPAPPPADVLPAAPRSLPALSTTSALTMLGQLPEAAASVPAYNREYFKHWTDADKDGCNTRAEVLLLETVTTTTIKAGTTCTIVTGKWVSLYDAVVLTDASKIDIDHMVPLAESWRSGAAGWDAAKREAFANDLTYPGSLIAVTAGSNRSKSDQDPATWMPTDSSYSCTYVAVWVAVKWRWDLGVDPAERTALQRTLSGCADGSVRPPAF
jgi:hypothetical protein